MKGNYNNWMPSIFVKSLKYIVVFSSILFIIFAYFAFRKEVVNTMFLIISIVLATIALVFGILAQKFSYMRKAFDYSNPQSIAWKIINYTASKVVLDSTEPKVLDVGCGSGALSIRVAKNHPEAQIIGVDKWGLDYQSEFSKELCESNATIEGVTNALFEHADARNLPFDNETFDAICSNYVYHNIPGDRNKILKESFRLLKKGGTFAIHDLFTKMKYPKLEELMDELKAEGYEKVELIDTADGTVISPEEARKTMLKGSKLLYGKK